MALYSLFVLKVWLNTNQPFRQGAERMLILWVYFH